MVKNKDLLNQEIQNTIVIKKLIHEAGIDLCGIAAIRGGEKVPTGAPSLSREFLKKYPFAIVMGVQIGKLGRNQIGQEASILLERAALKVTHHLAKIKKAAIVIHTEDEFDPVNRIGLFSLKALAHMAGLGWQGRSLLVISPKYGPLHRLIAILTDLPMQIDTPIKNCCDSCSLCVKSCPTQALTLVSFDYHPNSREEVLDIDRCLGDDACMKCINACPYLSG